jgi:hypothetical protein
VSIPNHKHDNIITVDKTDTLQCTEQMATYEQHDIYSSNIKQTTTHTPSAHAALSTAQCKSWKTLRRKSIAPHTSYSKASAAAHPCTPSTLPQTRGKRQGDRSNNPYRIAGQINSVSRNVIAYASHDEPEIEGRQQDSVNEHSIVISRRQTGSE